MSQKYKWQEGMGEISGFGKHGMFGYEEHCRKMLFAGLKWFEEHPNADPKFKGMRNVYGILLDDNEDAKALSKAVNFDGECSGAQHQAVVSHILFIRKNGWDRYVEEMKGRKE